MKQAKIFIAFTFLLAFAVCVSAQEQTPKIVWKNLQEKYERFEDIKPTIINVSNEPIYFECNMELSLLYGEIKLLTFDEKYNGWAWNNMICGTQTPKIRKAAEKRARKDEKLKQFGKYVPPGCKLNPNEDFTFSFNDSQWQEIKSGPVLPEYKSGKFKFQIIYSWYNSQTDNGSTTVDSPEFLVIPKEESK